MFNMPMCNIGPAISLYPQGPNSSYYADVGSTERADDDGGDLDEDAVPRALRQGDDTFTTQGP